jgi:hypothetical protein
MPPPERRNFHQMAVLWSYVRTSADGEPILAQPVNLRCRWEEGQTEIPNADGTFLTVDATVSTIQNILLNSIIWEGQYLPDGTYQDPQKVVYKVPTIYLYEVVIRNRGKNVRGRVTRYEFGIRRYKDILPTVLPPAPLV